MLDKILIQLEQINFPINKTRTNISDKKQLSFCLGDVNYRGQASLNYQTRGSSRYNKKFPELYKLLVEYANQQGLHYTTIQINKNVKSLPHIDKNNVGLSTIIALGNFTGGELIIEGVSHNIHNVLFEFDGKKGHWVNSFDGTRYSIIFFTHTFKPPNPKDRGITVSTNGLYKHKKLIKTFIF